MSSTERKKVWVLINGVPTHVEVWERVVQFKEVWALACDGSFQTTVSPDARFFKTAEACMARDVEGELKL